MKLHIEWARLIPLKDGSRQDLIYTVDLHKLPTTPGLYILGRRWGRDLEAIYIGQARNIRGRFKGQLNNLRLMQHLRNAKIGKRFVLAGRLITKPGQRTDKCLKLVERGLIRYFLSEGHDLVNKQGTRLRQHVIESFGKHRKSFIPRAVFLERRKGE